MTCAAIYYVSVAVACLAIAIYNLTISDVQGLQCYSIGQMDYTQLAAYIKSLGNQTENITFVENLVNGNSTIDYLTSDNGSYVDTFEKNSIYLMPIKKSNPYMSLQKAIGVIYIILLLINLQLSFSVNFMSNMVIEDYMNMGKIKRFFGALCKILPMINIVIHWFVSILIIVIWGFVGTRACEVSISTIPGVVTTSDRYYSDTWTMNTVTTLIWMIIHYFGGLARSTFYQEPFMFSPPKGKQSCLKGFFFDKLGP